MKQCPNCQTTYADDSLQFCLQDGTPLAEFPNQYAANKYDTEAETVISTNKRTSDLPKQVEPIRFEPPSSYQTNQANWAQPESQPVIIEQREVKKSSTAMVVALSVLGTILLLGIGGAAAWLYFKNNQKEVAVNINAAPNRQSNANAANQNANLATPTPSPTPTPTPQPTLKPEDAKAITKDVKNVVDEWKDSTENSDINTHVAQYADTVDYYKAGRVNVARVRSDRQTAFSTYDSISVNIDNVKVTPDPSGEKATVVLDKEWNFEGEEKYSSGKVQQQLTFGKINGRWLITGEKDLKVYYVDK